MREDNDIQWRNVYSETGGKYRMTLTYISGESRNVTIEINGKTFKKVSLNSGGWGTKKSNSYDIELQPGQNVIRLYNKTGWMPDMDCMKLKCTVPTGIVSQSADNGQKPTAIYNLAGQNVGEDYRGIVIRNGRKVVNR